jgi:hypothetical protein
VLTREEKQQLAGELGLPVLGRSTKEAFLQLSGLFGEAVTDMQRFLRVRGPHAHCVAHAARAHQAHNRRL